MSVVGISSYLLIAAAAYQTQPDFRSDLDLVTVPCLVLDAQEKPVTGLTRDEFHVFDNGARRIVQSLSFDTGQPLTLGIIVDASDSQRDQLAEHRRTAVSILEQLMRPGDRAFVVWVDGDVRVWADLASSPVEIVRQMNAAPGDLLGAPCPRRPATLPGVTPASVCGGSPLWNAVYEAARSKLHQLTGNKALLVLTDGFDTGSTHTWREAADEMLRADASVYVIQYQSEFGGRFARNLTRLLEESGGAWFGAPAPGEYGAVISRIERDLRNRYVLTFRPDKVSGVSRHEIRVETTRPGLHVRARTAYLLQ